MPDTENDNDNRSIYKDFLSLRIQNVQTVGIVKMPNHNRADWNEIVSFRMDTPDVKQCERKTSVFFGAISIQHIWSVCVLESNSDLFPYSGKRSFFMDYFLSKTKGNKLLKYATK